MVDISERLIRSSDEVLHSNEDYKHVKSGKIDLLVHTSENIFAEHLLPKSFNGEFSQLKVSM
ncbi:MAG: hypothetical protein OJF59_000242 [Cytophagales bacterium]|jgi:hypothetical protein|nr:MAG: hypothetical protein OJF59_000242 [Cytophagales bacterium]